MFGFPEPVTIQSGTPILDPYSGEQTDIDWSAPTTRDEACAVAPGGSSEPTETARNAIDSDFDLIFDHDPGVTSADRVVVRGLTCEVDGHPFTYRSPFTGWEPGTLVRVKIREG